MAWKRDDDDGRTAIVSVSPSHNPANIQELSSDLNAILENAGFRTVIFVSTHEKNWHLGVDLEWVMDLYKKNDRDTLIREGRFLTEKVHRTILAMPVVAIAAVTGHAIANGMIFACMCDIRYMRKDRGYFCLPEVTMGILDSFLPSTITRFKTGFNPYITDVMIPTGNRVAAADLEHYNIIDRACDNSDDVMRTSLKRARLFSDDDVLFNRYIEEKFELNRPVVDAIDRLDPEKYPRSCELFWKLMEKMSVKA
jgi:enoyl-CoA hydratase/carnithine racemase